MQILKLTKKNLTFTWLKIIFTKKKEQPALSFFYKTSVLNNHLKRLELRF